MKVKRMTSVYSGVEISKGPLADCKCDGFKSKEVPC